MLADQNFPIINYKLDNSRELNGEIHGESFRDGIKELIEIRRNLLIQKNPSLKNKLSELAMQQFHATKEFSKSMAKELQGISRGAKSTIEDIVLLNNYTDFRDIILEDEGCTSLQIIKGNWSIAGQTWDMHKSAKNYVCLINIPGCKDNPGQLYFSLVGCLGMMGVNTKGLLIGVNNINTKNAKASIVWPALVRHSIEKSKNFEQLESAVSTAPVTSGHNYLISSHNKGAMWEVSPKASEKVCNIDLEKSAENYMYHTNHCLGPENKAVEQTISTNSTTHDRYEIIKKQITKTSNFHEAKNLLHSHDNYPKSICSHYESNAQDPSTTCGGGLYDFKEQSLYFWRGCPEYDNNFRSYNFTIENNSFKKVAHK